jgi:16S rRNA G966 N2-methylase RsmD
MLLTDKFYDDALNVSTSIDENESSPEGDICFDYIPTTYYFLEKLFRQFPFNDRDHIVDFGCGKGRVLFMAASHSCKRVTGYEISQERYNALMNNIESYQRTFGKDTVFNIYKTDVRNMQIDEIVDANRFFFQPFPFENIYQGDQPFTPFP